MKPVHFCGDSLARIRAFPAEVRKDIGYQLESLQHGEMPDDWKPFRTVGKGVKELRVMAARKQFRVIFLTKRAEAVYVLHAFEKKTHKTRKVEINLARKRFNEKDN